jgi:predicted esterase YcpF (UPF0227 family)
MRPTIVYLHGFNSSPASVKGRKIAAACARLPLPPRVHLPALHHRPAQAMRDVEDWLAREADDARALTFIGSSLGGYYATWLAQRCDARAVVINPAVRPEASLAALLGPQQNPYTGERYELTRGHFAELARYRVPRIADPTRFFLLQRSGDELLDWREAVAHYAGSSQYVAGGGDHGWEAIDDEIPAMLRFAGCGVTAHAPAATADMARTASR